MSLSYKIIVSIFFTLVLFQVQLAQANNCHYTAPSSRSMAMAGTFVAQADNANATWDNPAALAQSYATEKSKNHFINEIAIEVQNDQQVDETELTQLAFMGNKMGFSIRNTMKCQGVVEANSNQTQLMDYSVSTISYAYGHAISNDVRVGGTLYISDLFANANNFEARFDGDIGVNLGFQWDLFNANIESEPTAEEVATDNSYGVYQFHLTLGGVYQSGSDFAGSSRFTELPSIPKVATLGVNLGIDIASNLMVSRLNINTDYSVIMANNIRSIAPFILQNTASDLSMNLMTSVSQTEQKLNKSSFGVAYDFMLGNQWQVTFMGGRNRLFSNENQLIDATTQSFGFSFGRNGWLITFASESVSYQGEAQKEKMYSVGFSLG